MPVGCALLAVLQQEAGVNVERVPAETQALGVECFCIQVFGEQASISILKDKNFTVSVVAEQVAMGDVVGADFLPGIRSVSVML